MMQSAGLNGSVKLQIHNIAVEECFSIPWDELQVNTCIIVALFLSNGGSSFFFSGVHFSFSQGGFFWHVYSFSL